jgi:hypothetical protein
MESANDDSIERHHKPNETARLVACMVYGALFGFMSGVGGALLNYIPGWKTYPPAQSGFSSSVIWVIVMTFSGAFFWGLARFLAHQYELRREESASRL